MAAKECCQDSKLWPRVEIQVVPSQPMMSQGRLCRSGGLWLWELSHGGLPLLLFPLVVSEWIVVRGKGEEKGKIHHHRLPVPSVPLPLTFQWLLRSSLSKFQLHHPMHWPPHERSAPGDCVLVSAFSKVDLGSV